MTNRIILAATAILIAGGAAFPASANPSAPALVKVENDATVVQPWNITVDQLEELDLVSPKGDRIGDVEDVLADPSGKVVAVVVEYGGFLGVGEKEAVFQLSTLQYTNGKLVTAMTKAQLEALPNWR